MNDYLKVTTRLQKDARLAASRDGLENHGLARLRCVS
jgi:hypothetical protein